MMTSACGRQTTQLLVLLLPPANEVCEGYVFTHVCHSVHGGGWYPNMPCRWYPSMPCNWSPGGLQAHTQGGLQAQTLGGGLKAQTGGSPGPHLGRGGRLCIPACTEADPPMNGYCHRQYASYWNAFLFLLYLPSRNVEDFNAVFIKMLN